MADAVREIMWFPNAARKQAARELAYAEAMEAQARRHLAECERETARKQEALRAHDNGDDDVG